MRITENEIVAFIVGAAVGSITTYLIATRERRAISSIRHDIGLFCDYLNFSPDQYRRVGSSEAIEQLASYDLALAFYRWALRVKTDDFIRRSGRKLSATRLAALAIIFEELLGLSRIDACRAMIHVKHLNDFAAFVHKLRDEKRS